MAKKEVDGYGLFGEPTNGATPFYILCFSSVALGVGAGFLGMCLGLLLHYIQHIAYGYSFTQIISDESFLQGVSASPPPLRVFILFLCGLIAGFGWWALSRFASPLVSISQAIKTQKKMPYLATSIHALLQIITIALGSPLGREVAPREMAAIYASWLSTRLKLTPQETKIMLACGAGAGLAAVYNVPLGGALFVIEVLLCTYHWKIILLALMTCAIATLVSWWGLGDEAIYSIPNLTLSPSLITWSIITSPLFGVTAYYFIHMTTIQRKNAFKGYKMILGCIINFTLIGLLAIYFPALLGNGKSTVQIEFSHAIPGQTTAILLVLRCIIVWSSLRVGAQGGILTPSLACGALLGSLLGELWSLAWPTPTFAAFSLIGATAFLAAAQKMPLTAMVMMMEFTQIDLSCAVPLILAVSGALLSAKAVQRYWP